MVSLGSSGFGDAGGQIASWRDDFKDLNREIDRGVQEIVDDGADTLAREVEDNAPEGDSSDEDYYRPSGYRKLTESVYVAQVGPYEFDVIVDHPAAAALEYGSRPHYIRAVNSEYLHFKVDGQWVKKEVVDHPGTDEYRYARDAVDAVRPIIIREVQQMLDDAVARTIG